MLRAAHSFLYVIMQVLFTVGWEYKINNKSMEGNKEKDCNARCSKFSFSNSIERRVKFMEENWNNTRFGVSRIPFILYICHYAFPFSLMKWFHMKYTPADRCCINNVIMLSHFL